MKRTALRTDQAMRIGMLLTLGLLIGCDENTRLAELATESAQRQAEQNQEMSRLNREVAESHRELTELQHDLQTEQAEVGHQRDELEADREELAEDRHREPIIAATISSAALLLACLLPLVLAWYLLAGSRDESPDAALGELLTLELVAESPRLLPGTPPQPIGRLPGAPAESNQADCGPAAS